jgi:opacity protein-like surface antigen
MRRNVALGLVIVMCAAAPSTQAQGFYLGVDVGQSHSDVGRGDGLVVQRGTLTGTSRDEKDGAYGAFFGYAITKHFAIELAYSNLGETRYTEERDVPPPPLLPVRPPSSGSGVVLLPERQQTMIESESISLSLIGRYPLTETLFFSGRAGLAAHVLKGDLRVWFRGDEVNVIGGAFEQSSGAALLGAGLEWDFHRNWNARLQIQQHFFLEDEQFTSNVARGDVTVYTAGIAYRF